MSVNSEFDHLLVSNADFLRPFAVTLTKDSESAKDLYQETLSRAWANREKYNVGTNIKAWLYTIMRNIFINGYRRNAKHHTIIDNTPNEYYINSNLSIENEAEDKMSIKEIKKSIFNLPEIFKKPFMLYFDGYKYHEIASLLDEPLGTIKSRIHFARRLLKKEIKRFL